MGRASSAKKVSRAARASGRPGARRNLAWPVTVAGVVLLGVGLLAFTLATSEDPPGPRPNIDHWHAAYAIDNCGTFLPPLSDVTRDLTGLHTHDDSLIHLHPFTSASAGGNATLGAWGESVGLELSESSITAAGVVLENGDDCGGEPGVVQVKVWSGLDDDEGRMIDGDPADYAPQDGELVTIAFRPEGADIPKPPDSALASLGAPIDLPGNQPATSPTIPGTSTTAPVDTTTTTVGP